MLTELAAQFLLVDKNASDAADAIADVEKEEARLMLRKQKFNKIINGELATTKEQAKVNIAKTKAAILDAEKSIKAANDGWKMGLMTVELFEEEIKLYKDKLQVQIANEKQLEKEELTLNRVINAEKNRFSSLIKLQLNYIDTIDAIDTDSLENRLMKKAVLEDNFRLKQLEIQKLFLTEQMSNLEEGSTERLQIEMQLNNLILDEDQRIFDKKIDLMQQEKNANENLQRAKGQALMGYVKLAQGMAKEGSELAMALFIFEKVLAAQQVFIAGSQSIAAIQLAEKIYMARPDNALLGVAGIARAKALYGSQIVASKVATGINIAGILASTIQGISKKANGGMIEEFANGGMVHGNSHAQGGEKFAVGGRVVELEGGEAVINKRSTAMFKGQLSAMNSAGGGVKFADGGLMNMPSFAQSQFNATSQAGMMGAIGQGARVVVVESDISTAQNTVSVIEAEATI